MTYNTAQRSVQDSEVVELYEWTAFLPGLFGDYIPPTGPLVVQDFLAEDDCGGFTTGWAPHGNADGHGFPVYAGACNGEGSDSPNLLCVSPPLSRFLDADCNFIQLASTFDWTTGVQNGIYIRSIFVGGITSGGYHYLEKTFGPADGIVAGQTYQVQVLGRGTPGPPYGFRQLGMSLQMSGGVESTNRLRSTSWHTLYRNVIADGAGEINVRLGDHLMEYGMREVHMYFRNLRIFAVGGTPPDVDEGTSTRIYRFTSADRPITFQGNVYLPALLRRSSLQRGSGEVTESEMVVTAARDMDLVQEFFGGSGTPTAPLTLRMYRVEPSDLTTYAIPFHGEVMFGEFNGNQIDMTHMTPEARLRRRIPRMLNQPKCNWMLGDEDCRVDLASVSFVGTVSAVDGRVITVDGSEVFRDTDSAYFINGTVVGPNGERSFIEGTDGDDVIMMDSIDAIEIGTEVTLVAGDDFSLRTCQDRFSNALRFSGTTVKQPVVNPHVTGLA